MGHGEDAAVLLGRVAWSWEERLPHGVRLDHRCAQTGRQPPRQRRLAAARQPDEDDERRCAVQGYPPVPFGGGGSTVTRTLRMRRPVVERTETTALSTRTSSPCAGTLPSRA